MQYVLILLLGATLQEADIRGSTAMTTVARSYSSATACESAGERWRVEANAQRERRPRYYCIPAE